MNLVSFEYEELNGFLSQKIIFHKDVTFLHGINGSGKTSVLKAVTAIITPNIDWIIETPFKQLNLAIENEGNKFQVKLSKSETGTTISLTGSVEEKTVLIASNISRSMAQKSISSLYNWSFPNARSDFKYNDLILSDSVLKFISELPSPIFLGLDRTTLLGNKTKESSSLLFESEKNVTSRTMLDDAVEQAADLFKSRFSDVTTQVNKIFSEAQAKLILSLFKFSGNLDASTSPGNSFASSISSTIDNISHKQTEVARGLRKIQIEQKDINSVVIPFFQEVEARAKRVQAAIVGRRQSKNRADHKDWQESLEAWFSISPNIDLVDASLKIINDVNVQEQEATRVVTNYIDVMNSFINDSGKKMLVMTGEIAIVTKNSDVKNVRILSSGERQIFVLMTHLAMNAEMQRANVLIIDEPELSLHLKWQKQFVSAVQKLSPRTQIILATHSPEIINKKCQKLSC